jgi:hypothetical protein
MPARPAEHSTRRAGPRRRPEDRDQARCGAAPASAVTCQQVTNASASGPKSSRKHSRAPHNRIAIRVRQRRPVSRAGLARRTADTDRKAICSSDHGARRTDEDSPPDRRLGVHRVGATGFRLPKADLLLCRSFMPAVL